MRDLEKIVEQAEAGNWPSPESIDWLETEYQRSRRFFNEQPELRGPSEDSKRLEWLRSLRPEQVRLLNDWTTRGQLLSRVLHTLGALARLSVDETAAFIGGYQTAWSRIRALAVIAANAPQDVAVAETKSDETTSVKSFTHRPWPGSKEWHNWGIGLDEHGNWHLFHFQRWGDANAVYRWARHSHASVKIVAGAMADVACRFMERGVLNVTDDSETDRIKPTIARLRRVIKDAVSGEGHSPKGNPVQFNRATSAYQALVKFGRAKRTDSRHYVFEVAY